jgi:hypothetical protein
MFICHFNICGKMSAQPSREKAAEELRKSILQTDTNWREYKPAHVPKELQFVYQTEYPCGSPLLDWPHDRGYSLPRSSLK